MGLKCFDVARYGRSNGVSIIRPSKQLQTLYFGEWSFKSRSHRNKGGKLFQSLVSRPSTKWLDQVLTCFPHLKFARPLDTCDIQCRFLLSSFVKTWNMLYSLAWILLHNWVGCFLSLESFRFEDEESSFCSLWRCCRNQLSPSRRSWRRKSLKISLWRKQSASSLTSSSSSPSNLKLPNVSQQRSWPPILGNTRQNQLLRTIVDKR